MQPIMLSSSIHFADNVPHSRDATNIVADSQR
jgi:hypothetical protein